jgi:hypothetical protein
LPLDPITLADRLKNDYSKMYCSPDFNSCVINCSTFSEAPSIITDKLKYALFHLHQLIIPNLCNEGGRHGEVDVEGVGVEHGGPQAEDGKRSPARDLGPML